MKRFLLSFVSKLALALAVLIASFVFLVWLNGRSSSGEAYLAGVSGSGAIADQVHFKPLQEIFANELIQIPGIDEARFISPEILWIRLAPLMHQGEHHVRVLCEGIAATWAARARLTYVRVESRYGNEAYAVGNFQADHPPPISEGRLPVPDEDGNLIYTPEPTEEDKIRALALGGLTMEEVENQHGPALVKHASTGWAFWPRFKAHFDQGRVTEYHAWTPVQTTSR